MHTSRQLHTLQHIGQSTVIRGDHDVKLAQLVRCTRRPAQLTCVDAMTLGAPRRERWVSDRLQLAPHTKLTSLPTRGQLLIPEVTQLSGTTVETTRVNNRRPVLNRRAHY